VTLESLILDFNAEWDGTANAWNIIPKVLEEVSSPVIKLIAFTFRVVHVPPYGQQVLAESGRKLARPELSNLEVLRFELSGRAARIEEVATWLRTHLRADSSRHKVSLEICHLN
jgi:hypothetical protein